MLKFHFPVLALLMSLTILSACAPIITERPKSKSTQSQPQPQTPEEGKRVLKEAGKDVVYGPTLGTAAAAILIPPYGIYKLGQAGASALGYDLDASKALPAESRKQVLDAQKAVLSVPGRAVAGAAGEKYREKGKIIKDE